jgi:ATP-dependent helicase/nuclease subunit A
LGRITEQRDRRVRALSQPSYEVGTVTAAKATGQNGRQPADGPFASEGYGKAFGTAVHALFELLVRERAATLEGVSVQALLEHHMEIPAEDAAEDVQRARRMGEGLLASDLWDDVRAARRVYAEYPLTTSTSQADDADGLALSVQRGTIDLLYRTPEGDWHLVDFKTDRLADGANASLDAAHPYCRQVRAYGSAWAQVSGAAPARQGLWLADANALHVVHPA